VLVDRLAGLRSRTQMTEIAADGLPRPDFATSMWRDAEGRRWQEVDLAALSRHDQYLAIAA
jgi:twitching motility protein PilI